MDFSRLKAPDWLMIAGGAAMLVLGLGLDWTSVKTPIGTVTLDGPFDYFLTGGIAWLLVVAVGALTIAVATDQLPTTQPWPLIFLGATGVAVILMLLQLLIGGRESTDRGTGMIGAFLWAAIAFAGAYLNFTSKGGDIKDLTDINKLKASFSQGTSARSDETPPPPPPPPAT